MPSFVEFLEEISSAGQKIVVPPEDVERLTRRFGSQVRRMGQWNTSDGSLEIPVGAIAEAACEIGSEALARAIPEIRSPEQFAGLLESSSASALIGKIAELSRAHFRNLMTRLEGSDDPEEIEKLKQQVDLAIFGK